MRVLKGVDAPKASPHIGSLNEKPLHVALKAWLSGPGDRFEVPLEGFVIDIVQDGRLVEIQTKNFAAMKRKLFALTVHHQVQLIHPIAQEKWIVKEMGESKPDTRRKSPKRGRVEDVFEELVAFPMLLAHPNFSLTVLLIHEEEVRRYDPTRGWRRQGWVTHERRLLDVASRHVFASPADMAALLPFAPSQPFTTSELADVLRRPRRLAQRMAYCLREMGVITQMGKRARAILYERTQSAPPSAA